MLKKCKYGNIEQMRGFKKKCNVKESESAGVS